MSLSSFDFDATDPQAMWERTRLEYQVDQARKAKRKADAEAEVEHLLVPHLVKIAVKDGATRDRQDNRQR